MDVKLKTHWEKFVGEMIERGRFETSDDVIQEALRLLEDREQKIIALKQEIDLGVADWYSERMTPFDGEAIKTEGRDQLRAELK